MIQTTLNLSLNYKIHFDDIKSLSFCEEVRNKSNDFLSSDNHCLIFKGDELINSYIFQALYNNLEKNSKCIFISMRDNKSEVLNEWYGKTVIKSDKRFSYEEVNEFLKSTMYQKQ